MQSVDTVNIENNAITDHFAEVSGVNMFKFKV